MPNATATFKSVAVMQVAGELGEIVVQKIAEIDTILTASETSRHAYAMKVRELDEKLSCLQRELEVKDEEIRRANAVLEQALATGEELRQRLDSAQDDLNNMAKVSQIIAFERENHRLRMEVERLMALTTDASEVPAAQTFTRKKINGTQYMIADDLSLYTYDEEKQTAGRLVGHCVRDARNGRLKVTWKTD